MANNVFIVVEDKTGDYWEGSLVETERAMQLASRKVALLPVIPDLFRRAGIGGYHKRSWGAGLSLDSSVPKMVSPMTMFCARDGDDGRGRTGGYNRFHWCARLVIANDEKLAKFLDGEKLAGSLQLAADYGQALPNKCGLKPISIIELGSITQDTVEKDATFLIGGVAEAHVPNDGVYGFALYGMAPGLRVAWTAVSQAHE